LVGGEGWEGCSNWWKWNDSWVKLGEGSGYQVFASRKARGTESYVRESGGLESGEEPRVKWRRGGCCAETGQSLAVGSDDGDQRWADISNYAHSSLYF